MKWSVALLCLAAAMAAAVPVPKTETIKARAHAHVSRLFGIEEGAACSVKVTSTAHGVLFKVTDHMVEIAVAGNSAIRVSVSYTGSAPVVKDTPMVAPQSVYAGFTPVCSNTVAGVATAFGTAIMDSVSGGFYLLDVNGNGLANSTSFSSFNAGGRDGAMGGDKCANAQANTDVVDGTRVNVLQGQTQASCCQACDNEANCDVWIYASPGHEDQGDNCWLMQGVTTTKSASYRTVGGNITPPPPPPSTVTITLNRAQSALYYGAGAGGNNAQQLSQTSSSPHVVNTEFFTSHYWSTEGYAALGVSELDFDPATFYNYPASWNAQGSNVEWTISGKQVDMYFMPAKTMSEGISVYWDLIGRPAMIPRYAFGFLACRWGWQDVNYIWDMLSQFRSGDFPLDAWISDFEWYTPQPDYSLPDSGSPTFVDFGYNNVTFPNPIPQLKSYHEQLNLRFGGIRKPRLGNSDLLVMANSKGWTVNASHGGGAPGGTRNLNYSMPAVRDWYSQQLSHFMSDGVDFWWNDEGETFYFAFYWWNMAELATLQGYDKNKRFFTINRSYTPGMSRTGAIVWTGDIGVSFQSMQQVPGYFLNWALAGVGFTTCDIGGFNGPDDTPLLLTRWYQLGALMPIMRVHSTNSDTPHFPFLYGPDAANAMRKALNLRYQLVPYHYSNAHAQSRAGGIPTVRPLLMQYPTDPNVAQLTSQWLDGPYLLATPILNEDNSTAVYIPQGVWYTFNSTQTITGPTSFTIQNAALDAIPIYVMAGAVVPLAPIVQYTDALPGGPLTVQVYPGADGSFTVTEDDGITLTYLKGNTRQTTYKWDDTSRTLSWSVSGSFSDAHTFTQVQAVVFFPSGQKASAAKAIGTSGSFSF